MQALMDKFDPPNLNDIIAGVALQTSMGVQLSPDIVVLHVIMAKVVHLSLSLSLSNSLRCFSSETAQLSPSHSFTS